MPRSTSPKKNQPQSLIHGNGLNIGITQKLTDLSNWDGLLAQPATKERLESLMTKFDRQKHLQLINKIVNLMFSNPDSTSVIAKEVYSDLNDEVIRQWLLNLFISIDRKKELLYQNLSPEEKEILDEWIVILNGVGSDFY